MRSSITFLLLAGLSVFQLGASAQAAGRETVVVEGTRMDAAVVPVYKQFKAMTTGDFALYQSVFSTNYLKYAMGRDPEKRFKRDAEQFLKREPSTRPPKEFSYRYDESLKPFSMVIFEYPIMKSGAVPGSAYSRGSMYVEKEGADWKISIPPDEIRKIDEIAAREHKQRAPANGTSPRP